MENETAYRKHVRFYRFARVLMSRWLRHKFCFQNELCEYHGAKLVLSNHNTDFDPLLVAQSFPEHMYFVATEKLFGKGFLSRIIQSLAAPIVRLKGTVASGTVRDILKNLKSGRSVCIFAEGDRSYNGLTGPILPATGKLAKTSGAALVTYRMEGGYFSTPRWSRFARRGKMRGVVVGVYPPETLKTMTAAEVQAAIERDLYEDAYARQEEAPVAFRGRALAEHLETALCVCPACGKIGGLKSEGNRIFCSCGMSAQLDAYGKLTGEELPFSTITEWDEWQTKQLAALAETDGVWFSDTAVGLTEIFPDHTRGKAVAGSVSLGSEGLSLPGLSLSFSEIEGVGMHRRQVLLLNLTDGRSFELGSPEVRNLRKYSQMISLRKALIAAK